MKNLIKILILTIIFVSCKTERKDELPKSKFSLIKDYANLTNNMGESDTIKVWMNLSQCTYQGIEKLTITRKKDSLIIQPEFANSMLLGTKFKKMKPIMIPVNDTIWKFNEFLKRNKNRMVTDRHKYGRLQIMLNGERLNFMTQGLGDSGKFLIDYCNTMKNLMPDSEYHIYAGTKTSEVKK